MNNNTGLVAYIVNRLQQAQLRHEVEHFPSGAVMIDIWIGDRFYVVQLDGTRMGLSEVTGETSPFDVLPDQVFEDQDRFKAALEKIILPGTGL
ncbi:hypothetical protein [Taibaiella chishuiensis]|uniref:Uncharacterized protein n=1 Tax=Taibaiella chishuiensis TaxID=1434707 RepID=A0A2P8CY05_9BACT|nr:hypothetical protein [Taibaiella chishuiensis]PSK89817.1 hypothetical protein B0I18_110118 [Taibaiella chishuiensis]